jgi:hypothetical protein
MLVIITEDSGSGHRFWRITKQIALGNTKNCDVVIAGTLGKPFVRGKAGGVGSVRKELDFQVNRLKNMPGRHLIVLAIDNVQRYAGAHSDTMTHVMRVLNHLRAVYPTNTANGNTEIDVAGYNCIEEVFLSFKDLPMYCCVDAAPPNARDKARRIYARIHDALSDPNKVFHNYLVDLNDGVPLTTIKATSDLRFLYKKHVQKRKDSGKPIDVEPADMQSREKIAWLALEYISGVMRGVGFAINKSGISACWKTTCSKPNMAYPAATRCDKCEVLSNGLYEDSAKWGRLWSKSLLLGVGNLDMNKLRRFATSKK